MKLKPFLGYFEVEGKEIHAKRVNGKDLIGGVIIAAGSGDFSRTTYWKSDYVNADYILVQKEDKYYFTVTKINHSLAGGDSISR